MIRMIREKLAFVLWLVIAAFIATIVFEWGMGGFKGSDDVRSKGYIAKINGEDIKYAELKRLEQRYLDDLDAEEVSGVKAAEMRQKAWNDLIRMVVIRQEIEKQDIIVSPERLYHEIINNPLPEFKNSQQFLTDGQFDQAKYEQFIKNPKAEYEDIYRALEQDYAARIPGMILESRVSNSVSVSDFELRNKYREEKLKAQVKYLAAKVSDYMPDESEVTDKEIEEYYKNNKYEFPPKPEERNFDYVLFSTAPTARDTAMALDDVNYALDRINNGMPFEEVAKNYSEDGSAAKGGDLGYFERGKMVPEFDEAAFSAETGEVIGPVETQYGYHIIKVSDKKEKGGEVSEIKASHILIKFKTYRETYEDARYSAVNFMDELYRNGGEKGSSFKETAAQMDVKVQESPFIQRTDRTSELGIIPGLGDFLFEDEPGTISTIMTCDAGYAILRIKEVRPEREKTLDEVRRSILFKLRKQKALEKAYSKLVSLSDQITDTLSMSSLAESENLKTSTINKIGPNTHIDDIGNERQIYETAMSMNEGNISEPFKGEYGAYIIYLIERDRFDQKKYEEEKEAFRQRQEMMIKRQVLQEWLDGLIEKADIVDYRGLYR
ncbi:MAG: peptidylprolyl isomerase [Candidatus Delongbacteria bacterium]